MVMILPLSKAEVRSDICHCYIPRLQRGCTGLSAAINVANHCGLY
jgi:hypothetical protein